MTNSHESNAHEILQKIRDLHSPLVPPKGKRLMFSEKGIQYCEACLPEDPFYAVEWPCETRLLADEEIDDRY